MGTAKTSAGLPVLNLATATFECTYGRGCEGVCCREGKPPLYPEEVERLDAAMPRLLPLLRPEARAALLRGGYLTNRRRFGMRLTRNVAGWCIFFNKGCTLHAAGEADGDKFRYKPAVCALFPVQTDKHDQWYIRQKGYKGEKWDLFCLDPKNTAMPASKSLKEELALARKYTEEATAEGKPSSILTRRWDDPPPPEELALNTSSAAGGGVLRILVTRYLPRGLPKSQYTWEKWIPDLGPSRELHAAVYGKKGLSISWEVYRARYLAEMKSRTTLIDELARLVAGGRPITLLCSSQCTRESRCHRSLLKELIQQRIAAGV